MFQNRELQFFLETVQNFFFKDRIELTWQQQASVFSRHKTFIKFYESAKLRFPLNSQLATSMSQPQDATKSKITKPALTQQREEIGSKFEEFGLFFNTSFGFLSKLALRQLPLLQLTLQRVALSQSNPNATTQRFLPWADWTTTGRITTPATTGTNTTGWDTIGTITTTSLVWNRPTLTLYFHVPSAYGPISTGL